MCHHDISLLISSFLCFTSIIRYYKIRSLIAVCGKKATYSFSELFVLKNIIAEESPRIPKIIFFENYKFGEASKAYHDIKTNPLHCIIIRIA